MRHRLADFPQNDINPFPMPDISEKVYIKKTKVVTLVNNQSGETTDMIEHAREYMSLHDGAAYVKLFRYGFTVLGRLSKRGTTLLCYVMSALKPGQNTVRISQGDVVTHFSALKGGNFYSAVTNLLEWGVIARTTEPEVYYINANIVFNGDRRKAHRQTKKKNKNQ
jgi:hypothetical protein